MSRRASRTSIVMHRRRVVAAAGIVGEAEIAAEIAAGAAGVRVAVVVADVVADAVAAVVDVTAAGTEDMAGAAEGTKDFATDLHGFSRI